MINELFREIAPVPSGSEIERRCILLGQAIDPSMDVVAYGFSLAKRKDIERRHIKDARGQHLEAYNFFDGYYDDNTFFGERPSLLEPLTKQEAH